MIKVVISKLDNALKIWARHYNCILQKLIGLIGPHVKLNSNYCFSELFKSFLTIKVIRMITLTGILSSFRCRFLDQDE